MPYVNRDEYNNITGVFNLSQRAGQERVDNNHADLSAYKKAQLDREAEAEEKRAELKKINEEVMRLAIATLKARGEKFKHF